MDENDVIPVSPGQLDLFGETPEPMKPWVEIMPKLEPNVQPTEMGFELRVAPDLQRMVKPVGLFTPHPDNARKHNLPKIAESLAKFGQQIPIVVQKSTGYICKGNGTYEAATRLMGATLIAASVEDFDDDTAFRYLLADNRASDLAEYDRDIFLANMERLLDGPRGLQDTLWDADALDDYRATSGVVGVIDPEFTGGYNEDPAHLAERQAAASTPGQKLKEVPLNMSVEDHARFMEHIGILRKAYGTTGTISTVVEAVRREAVLHGASAELVPVAIPASPVLPSNPPDLSEEAPEPTEEELLARLMD